MHNNSNFRDGPHNMYVLEDDVPAAYMQPPGMQMPNMHAPHMQMPDMKMPDMKMPDMHTPHMPGMNIPDMVLAMAYVPDQKWDKTYESETGLHRGTIFPELDKPFLGKGGMLRDR